MYQRSAALGSARGFRDLLGRGSDWVVPVSKLADSGRVKIIFESIENQVMFIVLPRQLTKLAISSKSK